MNWHFTLAAICLLAADAPDEVTRQDIEKWQGTWHAVSMETNGKASTDEQLKNIKLTVKGTNYHFQNGAFSEHGSYQFHATKSPKEIDIVAGEGQDKGKVYLVIYQVDGDRLTLCLESANSKRPTEFTGKAGSGCVLEVWQRDKP